MFRFVWNVFESWRYGEVVTVDDPWGYGNSLEWATSCPPPRHNFTEQPRIRSERPAFELHYSHMVQRKRSEAHIGRAHGPQDKDVTRSTTSRCAAEPAAQAAPNTSATLFPPRPNDSLTA